MAFLLTRILQISVLLYIPMCTICVSTHKITYFHSWCQPKNKKELPWLKFSSSALCILFILPNPNSGKAQYFKIHFHFFSLGKSVYSHGIFSRYSIYTAHTHNPVKKVLQVIYRRHKMLAAYYLQRSSKAIGRPVGYRGDQQMIRFDNSGTKGKVTADFL